MSLPLAKGSNEYEQKRLENIAKNKAMLRELELDFQKTLVVPTASTSKVSERYVRVRTHSLEMIHSFQNNIASQVYK